MNLNVIYDQVKLLNWPNQVIFLKNFMLILNLTRCFGIAYLRKGKKKLNL